VLGFAVDLNSRLPLLIALMPSTADKLAIPMALHILTILPMSNQSKIGQFVVKRVPVYVINIETTSNTAMDK
jgi:hypothetical protein